MKIINIASGDNFQDILQAVKETKSSEIILVVPKSNRVFKTKNRVGQLKIYFERWSKQVSILSSSPVILDNARLAGFEIRQETPPANKDEEIASLYSEEIPEKKESEPEFKKIDYHHKPLAEPKAPPPGGTRGMKKFILIFLGAAFAVFVLVVFTALTEAKIKLVPRKNDFSINVPLIISNKITQVDAVYGMIPGELIGFEKLVSKVFLSTGEKEIFQKATGKITIFNNYGTAPQILVATTRFQTAEGLVFRILKTIAVPGATKVSDKLEPGQIEVEVIADRAGEDYNIKPADFKIPGFLGSPKYQGLYAKSFNDFSGGFIGRARYVTKNDLEQAEEMLRKETSEIIKSELASLAGFKILDKVLKVEIEKTADSNKADDVVDKFKVVMKAKVETIAFKEEDVVSFTSQYVENSQNLKVSERGLNLSYNDLEFNREDGELSLKLISSGQTFENIDKDKIVSEILGKSSAEIKNYFNNLKEVESAQILLSPFWVKKVPEDKDKVEVEVIFN